MVELIGSLAALLLSSLHYEFNYMDLEFAVARVFLSIPIAAYFSRRLGVVFGVLSFYVLIASGDAASALTLLVFLFSVTELTLKWEKGIKAAIPVYTVLNCVYVIVVHLMNWRYGRSSGDQGFLDYSGMNACLIASCAGFFLPFKKWGIGFFFLLTALYLSHSAMGWGVLGVVLAARLRLLWVFPLALLVGYLCVGGKMLDTSGRFEAYRVFMGDFFQNGPWVFGAGIGMFKTASRAIQVRHLFMMDATGKGWWWKWMHSDALESVFQLGVIGGALLFLSMTAAFLKALLRNDLEMFSLLCGYLAMSLFDYPCQYAPTAFLFAFSVVGALRKEGSPSEGKNYSKATNRNG